MLEAPKNLSRHGISIRTSQNSPGERLKLVTALRFHDHAFGAPYSGYQLRIERDLHFLRYAIGLKKKLRHFVIHSEVHVKPIVTRLHEVSRAFHQLHISASSFDWFTVQIVCVVCL